MALFAPGIEWPIAEGKRQVDWTRSPDLETMSVHEPKEHNMTRATRFQIFNHQRRGNRQRPIVACIFAALVAATGCSLNDGQAVPLPPDGDAIPILRQWSRTHSHEPRALRLAIRDAADLAMIPLDEFDVDFSQEMVLIVTLGRMPSDQFRVQIDGVRRERGQLIADITVVEPPPHTPMEIATPYCVAIIPRCDLPVRGFAIRPPPRRRTWTQSELRPPTN